MASWPHSEARGGQQRTLPLKCDPRYLPDRLHTKTQESHQFPALCHVRRSGWRKREGSDTSLLQQDCTCWRLHRKGPWSVRRYWSTPGCLLTTLPSCTNLEGEAVLKPAINSPNLAADFALRHLHPFCSTNGARNLHPLTQDPLTAGPGCPHTALARVVHSLCGAMQAPACLPASTSPSPVGSSTWTEPTQPAALSQAVQTRREAWAVVFLIWHWHPPLGPSCLQKFWETLTQFADDLCSAVYFKHKQLPVINKQDLNTLETSLQTWQKTKIRIFQELAMLKEKTGLSAKIGRVL